MDYQDLSKRRKKIVAVLDTIKGLDKHGSTYQIINERGNEFLVIDSKKDTSKYIIKEEIGSTVLILVWLERKK